MILPWRLSDNLRILFCSHGKEMSSVARQLSSADVHACKFRGLRRAGVPPSVASTLLGEQAVYPDHRYMLQRSEFFKKAVSIDMKG